MKHYCGNRLHLYILYTVHSMMGFSPVAKKNVSQLIVIQLAVETWTMLMFSNSVVSVAY